MVVPLPVVAHGAVLGDLGRILLGQKQLSVHGPGRPAQQLHSVHGLAHIAAAAHGDGHGHSLLPAQGQDALLPHNAQGPFHRRDGLLRRQGFEFKHRAPGEQGVVYIKIRILRGGGHQGDLAVFHVLQQALLLLFVEILYLIQVQQRPVGGHHGPHIRHDVLHILERGGGGVEMVELLVGLLGDDARHGGLARAGRPVEDQVRGRPTLDDPPEHGPRT